MKPRLSHSNGTMLKNLVIFPKGWQTVQVIQHAQRGNSKLFHPQQQCIKKGKRFHCATSLNNLGPKLSHLWTTFRLAACIIHLTVVQYLSTCNSTLHFVVSHRRKKVYFFTAEGAIAGVSAQGGKHPPNTEVGGSAPSKFCSLNLHTVYLHTLAKLPRWYSRDSYIWY